MKGQRSEHDALGWSREVRCSERNVLERFSVVHWVEIGQDNLDEVLRDGGHFQIHVGRAHTSATGARPGQVAMVTNLRSPQ
jgi:hypothetical protein